MSLAAERHRSGVHLFPNLGGEEGPQWRQQIDSEAPRTVRNLWRLLFASPCFEIGQPHSLHWPEELGPEPTEPVFAGLENRGGFVPWLSTQEALEGSRQEDLAYCAAAPEIVERVHDKAFAHRLAIEQATLEPWLADCLAVLEPDDLADPERALRTIQDRLEKWPPFAPVRFTLKPRFGSSGRGRVAGRADDLDTSALRGSLKRLASRGGAILEPWLDRCGDFSAHWFLDPSGELRILGTLEQVVSPAGVCRGHRGRVDIRGRVKSACDPDERLREASLSAAEAARDAGYTGPLGVDAFAYRSPQGTHRESLRPIVEINARFTVGCVVLGLVRRVLRSRKELLELEPGVETNFYFGLDAPPGGWQKAQSAAEPSSLFVPLFRESETPQPGLLFSTSREAIDAAVYSVADDKRAGAQ